ncbi:relaxase/mobilization nuclease domain-containing protein [Dyadobacter psychrotolerans]|uniref:MobA/VirD2-like nuclease domain-containing protein n=1 Tax=Dyadobacter psychrotolerans TaxID=2541721 RepID=A0A4R5E1N0_9BACT|nr:relaxase/mobilization nuclease domain-containing protein [Dyadobacter psychrotolerans]TDE17743.1 hypothetical protein E0F88_07580 [Dyadobacter psychrotolerans]
MIIKGASRGNAEQLADYLLTMGNNEEIRVFGIEGATTDDLKQAVIEMGRFEEITKSKNPVFHAIIRPSHAESLVMPDEHWLHSIKTHQKNLGWEGQPWAGVMHKDDDGWHMHVVHQKYDPATGKMRRDNHTHHKNDNTREELEIEFNHPRTPRRNLDRPVLTKNVIEAWQASKDGPEFIKNCRVHGYTIAFSTTRRPYMIIDEKGRSFDLMKKLVDKEAKFSVRTKQMRERMKNMELPLDKVVIKEIRANQKVYKAAHENKELFEDIKPIETDKARRKREFLGKFTARDRDKDHER